MLLSFNSRLKMKGRKVESSQERRQSEAKAILSKSCRQLSLYLLLSFPQSFPASLSLSLSLPLSSFPPLFVTSPLLPDHFSPQWTGRVKNVTIKTHAACTGSRNDCFALSTVGVLSSYQLRPVNKRVKTRLAVYGVNEWSPWQPAALNTFYLKLRRLCLYASMLLVPVFSMTCT